jgi:hypothetical protein
MLSAVRRCSSRVALKSPSRAAGLTGLCPAPHWRLERAGQIEQVTPKAQEGGYFPSLLERRHREGVGCDGPEKPMSVAFRLARWTIR